MIDFKSKLAETRDNLQELGNAVSNLINSSPDVLENPEIDSRFKDFHSAYEEATKRLEKPSFCISTIGTTSSGKSTIVNALIGRKIAPIENGEMSGGILTINHSEEHKLIISTTENGVWEAGEWTGINDKDCYERIRSLMHRYHEHRRKKDCNAPDVTAFAPLLPVCDPSLLGLPQGVGVEFIDLPGVKSVLDRTNLEIIQRRVYKAFSLVALDYTQVDETHREKLLEELKKVVKYLGGRTDSMIFILNRVDRQTSDDIPLEELLVKLKQQIQEVLSLQSPPDILPFNALLLYHAQCAWGSGALNEVSKVNQQTRLQILKDMFDDCSGTINAKVKGRENRDLRNWFRGVQDQVVEDEEFIDDETMRKIILYALKWSGGEKLWDLLRSRVQESFSELVLFPALIDIFQNYDALEKNLDLILQTRKIYDPEQIQNEREKIAQIRKTFPDYTQKICLDFRNEIEEYIEAFKTNDPDLRSQIIQKAIERQREGFQPIFDAVSDVETDLNLSLILPMRDALKSNQGAYDLEEKLGEVISPPLANRVARAYDNVSRILKNFMPKESSEYLTKRVREDDRKGVTELENDQRRVLLLYHTMREGLSARAEFSLQAKARDFTGALDALINEQIERLRYLLMNQEQLSSLNIEQAVISDLSKKLGQNPLTLPEKIFEITTEDIQQSETTKTEKIGKKVVTKTREVDICFDDRPKNYTVEEDVMGKVKYEELLLPNIDKMVSQWSSGLQKGKDNLWTILSEWIINRSEEVITMFEESVQEIIELAERTLAEQLNILEQQEEEMERWNEFEIQKDATTAIRQKLEEKVSQSNIL